MPKAQIIIKNIQYDKSNLVVSEISEVQVIGNKYYFSVKEFSQELVVEEKLIKIIRPEMTINLILNKTIESIYPVEGKKIKMKFKLNKLKRINNDLEFAYSLISIDNEPINTIEVSIKF